MDKKKILKKILAGFLLLLMVLPICATLVISVLRV